MARPSIEEKLLANTKVEKSINDAVKQEIADSKVEVEEETFDDIKKVPKKEMFTNATIFNVFNRIQKTEQDMTGAQVLGLLGANKRIKDQLRNGEISEALNGDYFIQFKEYVR